MNTKQISVLLVGDRNTYCDQIEILLSHTRWNVYRAYSVAEAKSVIDRRCVQVILCQRALVDGSWRDVLRATERCERPASVVLLAPLNNRTWDEAVNAGGYDLLPVPCVAEELYSVIPAAWRHCVRREHREPAIA